MSRAYSSEIQKAFVPFRDRISDIASQLKDGIHVWEAQISLDMFIKIKILISEIPNLDYAMKEMKEEMAKLIRYYVAEWYKREYHDNCEMNIPGLSTQLYKETIITSGIEHNTVSDDEGSRTMWLDTLEAEGGIPVYDVINKLKEDRGNSLTNSLEYLYETEGELDEGLAEMLFRNNQTIKRSRSIRELIPFLQKGNMPYNPEERINSEQSWTFEDFTKTLEEVRQSHQRSKFTLEYHLWKLDGFPPSLKTCIRFKPDEVGQKRNFAISTKKLEFWGIDPNKLGKLQIKFSSLDTSHLIPLFKCKNEDWIPFVAKNIVETELPPFKDIDFELLSNNDVLSRQRIKRVQSQKGYIQFFSSDGSHWTSFGASGKFSLVVFDPDLWSSPEASSLGESGFEYIPLIDGKGYLFSNKEKTRQICFNNAEGNLFIEPSHILFTTNDHFGWVGSRLECNKYGEDDRCLVYVTDRINFQAKFVKTENNGSITWENVADNELRTYVWKNGDRWEPIDKTDNLLGFQRLRFKAKNKEAKIEVFFLPKNSSITRKITANSKQGSVELSGIEQPGIKVLTNGPLTINSNGNIQCSYTHTGTSDGFMLDIIDDGQNILHVGTYWPYDMNDIIKETDNGRILFSEKEVATVFAGTYIHRKISKNGVSLNHISEDGLIELKDFIRRGLLNGATIGSIDGCTFKLFNKELGQDNRFSNIVESGNEITIDQSQLKFVFIPSNYGDIVPLNLKLVQSDSYREAKNCLFIDIPDEISEQSGIIFQSLEGDLRPNIYFRPKYKPASKEPSKIRPEDKVIKQKNRIKGYFSEQNNISKDYEISLRAFILANKIHCHFGWFDELKALLLINNGLEERLVSFFEQYVSQCEKNGDSIDFSALWKLVGEFMLDWILIPARFWKELLERNPRFNSKYIETLFRSRPGAQGATKYKLSSLAYTILNSEEMKFTRTSNNAGTIAKLIRGKNKELYKLITKKEDKIQILQGLNNDEILDDIISLINK